MIRNYFLVAWRNLQRNRVFSAINILGLSLGLTCCILITLYIRQETSYDSYHKNADRLYQVGSIESGKGQDNRFWGSPSTLAGIFQSIYPQISGTARLVKLFSEDKTLLQYHTGDGSTRSFYEDHGYLADSGFFRLFTYRFVEGSAETAISGPYSVVLSKEIADKLFGPGPCLGKTIHVSSPSNGEHDYKVTGVFQPINAPSHIDGRFFLSMYGGYIGDFIRTNTYTAANYFFYTYIMLKPGADRQALEKQFPSFVDTYEGKDLKGVGVSRKLFLIPVKDIHLHADMPYGDVTPGGSLTALYILASIALFTLLIACINFMNLSTARSIKRSAEVGVRKALGAPRSSLIRQFLGESLLMGLIAFGIALALSILLFPAFEKLSGKTLYISIPEALGLTLAFWGLAVVTGLIAGIYPAFYLSSFQPVRILKGKISNSLAVVSLRKGLVVFQFIISIMLIVASVVIIRQVHFLRTADLGFDRDQQVIIPLREKATQNTFTALKSDWLNNPNVQAVAGAVFYPGGERPGWDASFSSERQTARDSRHIYLNYIDFEFMKALNLQAVSGRIFSAAFPSDSIEGVVLNQAAVRQLGYDPATCIGKPIFPLEQGKQGAKATIVGVIKDFHFEDFHNSIAPMAFEVFSSYDHFNFIIVHLRPGVDPGPALSDLGKTWSRMNPGAPFEYRFLDAEFQAHYASDLQLAAIVGWFTAIAICISCLGLFGLAAFSAEQRTKEIGIRKVLGAGVTGIVALLSKDFLRLVSLAILVGSPLAWYIMQRWLQGFAYRTTISWSVFAITAGLALLIAFATVSFQAIKAAIANPVDSLRNE